MIEIQFGKPGWQNLVKASGRNLVRQREYKIDSNHLLNHYKEIVNKWNRHPSAKEFIKDIKHGGTTIGTYFGRPAWRNLVRAAGGTLLKGGPKRSIDRSRLIQEYRVLKEKIGHQPAFMKYVTQAKHAPVTIYRNFPGGWHDLVEAAGDICRRPRIRYANNAPAMGPCAFLECSLMIRKSVPLPIL